MTTQRPENLEEWLLAATMDAVLVFDPHGTVTYQGPTVTAEFGYEKGELLDNDAIDFVHPDDREDVERTFRDVLESDRASDRLECRIRDADDAVRWVELAVTTPGEGPVDGVVVSVRDVSERVRADRERTELIERMTDAFLAVDAEWRFTYTNERAENLLGIEEKSAIGTELWALLPELVDTTFAEQFRRAMTEQETETFEAYYEPLDTWFAASVYPAETGMSVFFEDVTERVRTEMSLAKNEKALHELHDIAADNDLRFEEKLVRLLDLGRERLDVELGFLTRIEDGEQRIVACEGEHDLLNRGASCPLSKAYCQRTIEVEGLLATRDAGEEWVPEEAYDTFGLETYVGGKLVVEGELYGTLCFADTRHRDHEFRTDEKAFVELLVEWMAYELERDHRQQRLEDQNERLEAFASMVSHDLRNPLTVAQGHLDHARETGDADAFDTVADAHARMERLIDDMLWLAREGRDVGATEAVDLEEVSREAWAFVATPQSTLTVLDETAITVEADRDRLLQLFENLFRNAVEHACDEDGSVTVEVGSFSEGFYVADDGPGIPEEQRERAFHTAFTTAEDGTGYGLSTVERIAEAHGWTARIVDADAGGARFEFLTDPD